MEFYQTDLKNPEARIFFESLYEEAFPRHERRDLEEVYALLVSEPRYRLFLLTEHGERCGFMAIWQLDACCFVEHFAISPSCRGLGYGAQALRYLCLHAPRIILEVEPPESIIAAGRINFYQRNNFLLHDHLTYYQPPYRADGSDTPMLLMSYGDFNDPAELMEAARLIHKLVYKKEFKER